MHLRKTVVPTGRFCQLSKDGAYRDDRLVRARPRPITGEVFMTFVRMGWSRSRALRTAAVGTLTAAVMTLTLAGPASAATSRTTTVCQSDEGAFTVCLKATDSYTGSSASGYVAATSCSVNSLGVGFFCADHRSGSYWNSARGAHEDWLNDAVDYFEPQYGGDSFEICVYLRVDTKAGGQRSEQNFSVQKNVGDSC